MTWEEIPGWYDWPDLYTRAVANLPPGILVEVGCYLGRSLCHLGTLARASPRKFHVVGVDWCVGSGPENGRDNHAEAVQEGLGSFAGTLHRNVMSCGLQDHVSLLVASSAAAASVFPDRSLSMVFLDARHDYESVRDDIRAWLPKVRHGGWLCGDDVGVPGEPAPVWPGVRQALDAHLPGWRHEPHDAWSYEVVGKDSWGKDDGF